MHIGKTLCPQEIDVRNLQKIRTKKQTSLTRRLLFPCHSSLLQNVTATEIEWGNRVFENIRGLSV